jgi:fumarylacetoacetate (FAA) hydrolase
MFSPVGAELERGWPGRIDGDRVVQLAAQTLESFFTGGGGAREHAEYPIDEVELRPPVLHPPSIRVFAATERHEPPFFSFRNTGPVFGHDAEVPLPDGTAELDLGVGIAAVIGKDGAVAGVTLANDWTARDLERGERASGFGPSKSKDFALSLGPSLVTLDELVGGGTVRARVNGQERTGLDLGGLAYSWAELAAHAAGNTTLRPGEVLVCSDGAAGPPWLGPGDVVELELPGVGVLRNRLAARE